MSFDKRNLGNYSIPLTPPTKKKPPKLKNKRKIIVNEEIKSGFIKCPVCGHIQPKTNSQCDVCKLNLNRSERVINFITKNESQDSNFFLLFDDEYFFNQLISAFKDNNIYDQVKILDNANVINLSDGIIIDNFHVEISNLININKLLNFYYNIPFYNNVYSSKYLKNLYVLKNNPKYIDTNDLEKLLNFIKKSSENNDNINNIDFENISDFNDYINKLLEIKHEISEFYKNVDELIIFYNKFGIKCYDKLNKNIELINAVKILNDNPSLINNKNDVNNFINLLEKYKGLNKKNKDSTYFIKNFKVKNKILLKSFNYFNRIFRNSSTIKIESEIINLRNEFDDIGFNLIEIYKCTDFKNFLLYYKNAETIQDEDFYLLNEKLIEYFEISNINLSEYFKKFYKKLNKLVKDKISEKSEKLYEKSEVNTIKYLINDLFNQMELSKEIHNFNELKEYITDINNNVLKLQDILDSNNLEDFKSIDFNIILEETPESFKFSGYNEFYKRTINKIKNCNINNFDVIIAELRDDLSFKVNDKKLNEILFNFNIIKEILDLSSKLNLVDEENLFNYKFDDLLKLHKNIKKNIEFTDYLNNGLFNENIFNFYNSKTFLIDLNDVELKLQTLNNYIDNNDLILDDILKKSSNQLDSYSEFENIFLQTKELFNKEDTEISITDYKIIIDNLLYLCENNIDNNDEPLLFIESLLKAKDRINKYSLMYEYETDIDKFNEIININLDGIWVGYSTKLNKVKNKLMLDLQFTNLYQDGIFTDITLKSCNNFSKSDLKFLEKINRKLNLNYEKICDNKDYDFDKIYYNELLIQYFSQLSELSDNKEYYEILIKINKILNRKDFTDVIKSLPNKNYEDLIKKYDLSDEDNLLSIVENHVKYTQLIDYGVLDKNNIEYIKEEIDYILYYINQLEEYRLLIIERINKTEIFDLSTDFNEILNQISEKRIFILNKKLLNKPISKDFVDYFDKILIPRNPDEMYIEELLNATNKIIKML